MAQFIRVGTNGILGIPADKISPIIVCRLKKLLTPHHYMEPNNVYGNNDISALCDDPAYDMNMWPPMPKANMLLHKEEEPSDYYQKLLQSQIDAYTKNATQNGHMKSFQDVVKNVPLFDISKKYKNEDLEKYSVPEIALYEDEVDYLRLYGKSMFYPCLNRFTIKTNKQRYLYIEVMFRNQKDNLLSLRVEDYAGNRYNWIKETSADFYLQFGKESKNGRVSMNDQPHMVESYDDFLTCYIPEMNWDKKQKAFWLDAFGVFPLDNSVLVNLVPSKQLLQEKRVPDEAKQTLRFLLSDKKDIPFLRQVYQMNSVIEMDDTKSIRDLCAIQAYCHIKLAYIKTIVAVNKELIYDKDAGTKFNTSGTTSYIIGDMTVTSAEPLPIRFPQMNP